MVGTVRKLNNDPPYSTLADYTKSCLRQIMIDCIKDDGHCSRKLYDSIIKTYIESRKTRLKSIQWAHRNKREIYAWIGKGGGERVSFIVGKQWREVKDKNKLKPGLFFG